MIKMIKMSHNFILIFTESLIRGLQPWVVKQTGIHNCTSSLPQPIQCDDCSLATRSEGAEMASHCSLLYPQ